MKKLSCILLMLITLVSCDNLTFGNSHSNSNNNSNSNSHSISVSSKVNSQKGENVMMVHHIMKIKWSKR